MDSPDRTTPAPKRPRHLMDPDNLQQHAYRRAGLTRVQQWVLSTLAVTTILHLIGGLILAAAHLDGQTQQSKVGLLVISGLLGIMSVAIALAIHRRPVLHWSLALGVLPALLGAWFVL